MEGGQLDTVRAGRQDLGSDGQGQDQLGRMRNKRKEGSPSGVRQTHVTYKGEETGFCHISSNASCQT